MKGADLMTNEPLTKEQLVERIKGDMSSLHKMLDREGYTVRLGARMADVETTHYVCMENPNVLKNTVYPNPHCVVETSAEKVEEFRPDFTSETL